MPIEIKNISYTYMPHTPMEHTALTDINFTINEGEFLAVAGHTGSGKSTLLQHLNGLLSPTAGEVLIDGVNPVATDKKDKDAALMARRKVGMVFQYPERQLFEETVAADIAFGPKALELSAEEVDSRVREAMRLTDLDYDTYANVSPFYLSGGQMRRVAIAGILALEPKYLVLDEPTAGLDPEHTENLIRQILRLKKKSSMTIILVTHDMEIIARLADRIAVLSDGKLLSVDTPERIFSATDTLKNAGLRPPAVMQLLHKLQNAGLDVDPLALTPDEGIKNILAALKNRGGVENRGALPHTPQGALPLDPGRGIIPLHP